MAEQKEVERQALIAALTDLAASIEKNPPPIVGSDIFVHAAGGGHAVGSSISVTAGPGSGSGTGQRISVVANRPGQTVIGQRIVVVAGGDAGSVVPPPAGAQSVQEVDDTVQQLRDAAKALETSPASQSWIKGILAGAEKWGSAALSGAISGATNAATRFYLAG
jgi:hypothetical protein